MKLKIVLFLLITFNLIGCSSIQSPAEKRFIESHTIDVGSTALALTKDHLMESNPAGFGGAVAGKVVLYTAAKLADEKTQCQIYKTSPLFEGAAVNNTLLFLGVSPPIAVTSGVIAALYGFFYNPVKCGEPNHE